MMVLSNTVSLVNWPISWIVKWRWIHYYHEFEDTCGELRWAWWSKCRTMTFIASQPFICKSQANRSVLKTSLQSAVNFCRRLYTFHFGHLFPLFIMSGQNAGKKIINVGYPSKIFILKIPKNHLYSCSTSRFSALCIILSINTILELLKKISNPKIMILQAKQLQSRKFEVATQCRRELRKR